MRDVFQAFTDPTAPPGRAALAEPPRSGVSPERGARPFVGPRTEHPRRSVFEIRMDIMRAIRRGAKKPTQIMYRANLSWATLNWHLDMLVEGTLVRWSAEGA